MKRVHAIVFPQPSIDVIFFLKIGSKVHQDGYRLARHCPAPYPHLEPLFLARPLPWCKKRRVFSEIRTFLFFPEIGTNENNVVSQFILKCFSTSGKHGVDTTHFIAHFPTRFKDIIRL